jgi:hypothetical protein
MCIGVSLHTKFYFSNRLHKIAFLQLSQSHEGPGKEYFLALPLVAQPKQTNFYLLAAWPGIFMMVVLAQHNVHPSSIPTSSHTVTFLFLSLL